MTGLFQHLLTSLRLNFRNRQAIVFGYIVPIFFLVAFGAFWRRQFNAQVLAQVLTITILGGACFGMPIAMVTERERGVWRRYRLTPLPAAGFIVSVLLGRFFLVFTSALIQYALALAYYGSKLLPQHPIQLLGAFVLVSFAFLGIGLVIAMIANSTQAVQALGQSLFLPMIMIGGVGVPLTGLPMWSRHVAAFLPGRYAVEVMRLAISPPALAARYPWFSYVALVFIGGAALLAGIKLFRCETQQRLSRSEIGWVAIAVAIWAIVGLGAEWLKLV